MAKDDIARLRRDCELAWRIWARQMGGMQIVLLRERGAEALASFKLALLGRHQGEHYLDGLRKLGISDDPPAVAAAKYHYLSNTIGGLRLEYVEESPRKAWIRYLAPNPFYDGGALLAVPAPVQRAVFAAWHARNAERMGCPRLGYVCTKVYQDGEPYDEGYFIEYDHDIGPADAVRYERVAASPEFDPERAPRLDSAAWPEARLLKAKRKYAGAYVRTVALSLWSALGPASAAHVIEQAMRLLAVQFVHEIKAEAGIEGRSALAVARLLARLLEAQGDDLTLESLGPDRAAITLRSFKPFEAEAPEELRRAFFAFPAMCARVLNGRLRVARAPARERGAPGADVWEIEDAGRWLY